MFTRFSPRARTVMQFANQEAQRFNHEYIGTEHILLGIVREGSGVAANILKYFNIDLCQIRREIEKILQSGPDMVGPGKLPQTPRARKVVEHAIEEARTLKDNEVGTQHLLLGLLREGEGVAGQVLVHFGLRLEEVREELPVILGATVPPRPAPRPAAPPRPCKTPTLDTFGRELGRPGFGRAQEIEQILMVLNGRDGLAPLLVGPHGVGKRALAELLARHLAAADLPETLAGRRAFELSLGRLTVRMKDRRHAVMASLKGIVTDARRAKVLLFLPDLFSFPHAARCVVAGLVDAHQPFVAAALPETYRTHVAADDLLGRAFQPVAVEPPPRDDAVAMLAVHREALEKCHGVAIDEGALAAAVDLADRHLTDAALPGKAVRLLDQAAALRRMRRTPPPPDFTDLDTRLAALTADKERAIAGQKFETAARFRDEADALLRERAGRLQEWQETKGRGIGAVDARAVEEAVALRTGVLFRSE